MSRFNVYSEELGEGYQVIDQNSRQGEPFYGLRIWLKTPQVLLDHSTAEDDDRNAVTFFARTEDELQLLVDELQQALDRRFKAQSAA